MALEEWGCLQGSTDTLQSVKVTVLELEKEETQAVSAAGNLHGLHGQTGKSPLPACPPLLHGEMLGVSLSHPVLGILPQTCPLGECPLFFSTHLSFSPLWHPVSSCGL